MKQQMADFKEENEGTEENNKHIRMAFIPWQSMKQESLKY